MSEMFEAIEKQARARDEREVAAREERRAELLTMAQAKRRKATRAMALRLAVAVVICVLLSLAGKVGMMDRVLIRFVYVGLAAWASFWFGAWWQFMYCKGGLLQ